jgi:hypothetical protein
MSARYNTRWSKYMAGISTNIPGYREWLYQEYKRMALDNEAVSNISPVAAFSPGPGVYVRMWSRWSRPLRQVYVSPGKSLGLGNRSHMSKHNTGCIFLSSISLETSSGVASLSASASASSGRITIWIPTISLFLLSLVRRWMCGMCWTGKSYSIL